MKSKFQKLIWCIVIFITLINLITALIPTPANIVQATGSSNVQTVENLDPNADDNSMMDGIISGVGVVADGITGVVTWVIRLPFFLIAMAIQGIITGISMIGGSKVQGFLTPDDILTEGHQKELTTYKGVMVSKSHADRDMFKINLLNMLDK